MITWSNLSWKRVPRWLSRLSSTLSTSILKTSSDGDSTTSILRLFQWLIALSAKNENISFTYHTETFPSGTGTCCPLSCPCSYLWRESPHPLCSHPVSTGKLWWDTPFSSPGWKAITPSDFPQFNCICVQIQSVHFFFELWWSELDTVLQVQPDTYWVTWDD